MEELGCRDGKTRGFLGPNSPRALREEARGEGNSVEFPLPGFNAEWVLCFYSQQQSLEVFPFREIKIHRMIWAGLKGLNNSHFPLGV